MFSAPEISWLQLTPIIIVMVAAVVGVLVEALAPKGARRAIEIVLAFVALIASFSVIVYLWNDMGSSDGSFAVSGGSVVIDRMTLFVQGTLVLLSILAFALMAERTAAREDAFAPQASAVPGSAYEEAARKAGLTQTEVFPLAMFAVSGMMIFPAANDLLTMFVALEVFSLPLYLLCGLARRRRLLSQEASMKYFLLGAFASAFFLFGSALLYGFAGSVNFSNIASAAASVTGMDPLFLMGAALVLMGLLFKAGAVPFHSWMPDVYQGAPTPITAFMAACTKAAAFAAVLRVLYVALRSLEWDWWPALWAVAILTMLVGAVLAVVQTDIKRMLAYSSIAHAGFLLAGVASWEQTGVGAVLFYLLAYGVTTIGAFAIVFLVREKDASGAVTAEATHLSQWAGLGKRSPLLAGVFSFFLLAFAGIPLTSGFTGKFAVFSAAVDGGATWLAIVGVLSSAIAAFFYVRVIVLMFFTEPADDTVTVVKSEGFATVVIAIAAVVTIFLGIYPTPVLDLASEAAKFFS